VREGLDGSLATLDDVRNAVEGGADSIEVDLARVDPASRRERLRELAAPVLEAGREVSLRGIAPAEWAVLAAAFNRDDARIAAGIDPWGAGAGERSSEPGRVLGELASLAPLVAAHDGHRLLRSSGATWYDAGATAGWSLALAVASGLGYRRALVDAGVAPDRASRQVELELALGADLFEGIAAVRAARLIWARALELTGGAADAGVPLRLTATAGLRVLARRDLWTNALRETGAAFAAAVGGVDVLRLPPFDARAGASPAARRLARNTPLILREEGALSRVADPAGGSWYLDAATVGLAERVWTMLGEIDAAGGLAGALASGLVQRRIEEQRIRREAAVRRRERPLVGVSEFPDRSRRAGGTAPRDAHPTTPSPLAADAEPFERLLDAAAALEARGARGRVLLLRLGAAAEAAPRVAFARGVVEAVGLESVVAAGSVASADDVQAEFASSAAMAGVICGTDRSYASDAAGVAAALKQAGCELVLLAGRPAEHADALRAAGVDDFVFQGADIVAVMERVLHRAGVPS
jgi:methylmalonyl-CoA mutase